jgi:hypothetical protein
VNIQSYIVAFWLVWVLTACASSKNQANSEQFEPWVMQGALACSEAQLVMGNPLWDANTEMPLNKDFDRVEIYRHTDVTYFVVSIGFDHLFPDAPSAHCHIDKEMGNVLWAGFSGGEPGNETFNREKYFSPYVREVNIANLNQSSMDSVTLSLRDALRKMEKMEDTQR